ncbi:MAG: thrombospondin type 3 repeat-/CalX-beta domain-containing protein, partial [Colwellia sp.]|nr:thrombospondin type 3 repeat-/CalX-beta domain-containing protein [Colwellia sp.]
PLVNFSPEQTVAEGGVARVNVTLSGISPVYPLELPFIITGSVDGADYQLSDNKVVITQGTQGFIDIPLNTDFEVEGPEQVILTFEQGVNGGIHNEHIINVVETNVAANVSLSLQQNGLVSNQVAKDLGEAVINLEITDSNSQDTHVIDWQLPDYLSAQVSANQLQVFITPANVILPEENKGLVEVSVTVTDSGNTTNSGSEPIAQTKYFTFSMVDTLARLSTTDTDRDGITDINEGYSDDDKDGLPQFLDTSTIPYLQPLHVNSSIVRLAETEPGLHLQLGKYARLQFSDGVQLSQQEIEATGLIVADTLVHQGGYFDFEIHQVTPFGRSVSIVIPLSQAIVEHAVYRKYTKANAWQDFVIDANNAIASSVAVNGVCPPPQSELYQEGLIIGNVCLRLFIEDGGANDSDGIANGVIDDPGGIAVVSNETIAQETVPEKSSSGSFSYYFLLGGLLLLIRRLRMKKVAIYQREAD